MDPAPYRSLPARLADVFFAPGRLGETLRDHPRWIGALLVAAIVGSCSVVPMVFTERGKRMSREVNEEAMRELRRKGINVPEGQTQGQEKWNAVMPAVAFAWVVLFALGAAGILWVACVPLMGAAVRFKTMLAIVSHTLLIDVVGGWVNVALKLSTGNLMAHTSLAALRGGAGILDPWYTLLYILEFFVFWSMLATGVAVGTATKKSMAATIMVPIGAWVLLRGGLAALQALAMGAM